MDSTRHVDTSKEQNRAAFPELSPFVDALNAAMQAHGTAPCKVTYLYRPGLEIGRRIDLSRYVQPAFYEGRPATGSEFVRRKAKGR